MIHYIPLKKVYPNPWQTRQGDPDAQSIRELALSIAKIGLIQTPVGRVLADDDGSGQVELAIGHRRLAAYRWLHQSGEYSTTPGKFENLPVDVRPLSDEDMADLAWTENEQRRDHSPWERVLAIQKRIDDFGWTQEQVAERMQIARSTVTNLLALQKLDEPLRQALHSGLISTRAASALAPLMDLPETLLEAASNSMVERVRPANIRQAALDGASSDELRERISDLISRYSIPLSTARWPLDLAFHNLAGKAKSVRCAGCKTTIRRGSANSESSQTLCAAPGCFQIKNLAFSEMANAQRSPQKTEQKPAPQPQIQVEEFERPEKADPGEAIGGFLPADGAPVDELDEQEIFPPAPLPAPTAAKTEPKPAPAPEPEPEPPAPPTWAESTITATGTA
ncbi:MAG: ParB/RepB/Spo0J family partition protein [Candidatus Omnitrophota bacterium]|jgi:ParB/RepB/Spo0J family partition protein|nr:MAG: ParB/RepB/Spo0J family partition protein [Candidatus Omnitrophota bacterium]